MEAALRRSLAGRGPPHDLAAAALERLPVEFVQGLLQRPLVPAAVLVALRPTPAGLAVVLTRRTEALRDHPGQISFPGGRIAAGDAGPVATALREAEEEIGLLPHQVDVLGCLESQAVVTGFAVLPVVGVVAQDACFRTEPAEVAEVFEVPLAWLALPGNRGVLEREVAGRRLEGPVWDYGRHRIWGATAQMLVRLLEAAK